MVVRFWREERALILPADMLSTDEPISVPETLRTVTFDLQVTRQPAGTKKPVTTTLKVI